MKTHRLPPFPELFAPDALIGAVHAMALQLKYKRIRIDRGVYAPGTLPGAAIPDSDLRPYYEVGYGGGVIRVRTSWGESWEVTKENYNPASCLQLQALLSEGADWWT